MGWLGLGLSGYLPLEILDRMRGGGLKGALVLGEDPIGCALNPGFVGPIISSLEALVVQDLFLTPTAEMAQVVLPTASFAENSGHFVNFEGKVQSLSLALRPLAGISNLKLISELVRELGKVFDYKSVEEITDELERLPGMAGWDQGRISFEDRQVEAPRAVESSRDEPLFRYHCDAVERWFAETTQRLGIHF
jgi:predicted molibdopterin-dependent oxidoreductase YjgC